MIQITLKVEGMMCGMCETHICDTIRNKFPVKKVAASRAKKRAVILSEQEIPTEALRAAIAGIGYSVSDIKAEPYRRKKIFGLF
ncbi:MAG: copper resistance protein CopZ [Clostridia bacterium]|nr:copper resistance protein CopZ [Clostridia bacterium]